MLTVEGRELAAKLLSAHNKKDSQSGNFYNATALLSLCVLMYHILYILIASYLKPMKMTMVHSRMRNLKMKSCHFRGV